jgi:SAM-dependent methyltransferase
MSLARGARDRVGGILVGSLDTVYRRATGGPPLPPWPLRAATGEPARFERVGAEFLAYLKLLAELKPHEHVLDVGSGAGMVALELVGYLDEHGGYTGIDIDKRLVEWCRKNITEPHFSFIHVDLWNARYNSGGSIRAEDFRFPLQDGSQDVVVLKSVFTHTREPVVRHYLGELSRLLSPNGRCLATFFLLDEEPVEARARGTSLDFSRAREGRAHFAFPDEPEHAVAYELEFVREAAAAAGLEVAAAWRGSWSGRSDGLSYQDIVLLN